MASLPIPYEDPEDMAGGMPDHELLSLLSQHEANAIGYNGADGDITEAQARALEYYNGTMDDVPAQDGSSSVTDGTVALVVDNALASTLKPFVSSDETVRFSPRGPEDVEIADQATEYVNYIFNCDNPGFLILHNWFKDAFLAKVGVVKVWWEDQPRFEAQEVPLDGINDDLIRALPNYMGEQGGVAIIGQEVPDGRVKVANVPAEEFRISSGAPNAEKPNYIAHVPLNTTRSDLIEMGFDPEIVTNLSAYTEAEEGELRQARFEDETTLGMYRDIGGTAVDVVALRDEYVRVDYNGDGIAELRRIMRVGDVILLNEEVDDHPFALICPIPMPHKVFGHSLADRCIQEQKIATVLWRQSLDNLYKSNNPRPIVGEGAERIDGSTADGLEDNAPGAAIPVRDISQFRFDAVPFTAAHSLPMLELVEKKTEENTGIQRQGQGLDTNALRKSGQMTATEMSMISEGKSARTEMIARIFAETGVSRLFKIILGLVTKHQPKERIIRLRSQWVPVDPREWPEMDVAISVGLGIGDKGQQIGQAMTVLETMQQLAGSPYADLIDKEKVYNATKRLFTASGIKNTDEYLNEPQEGQGQPPQPDPEAMKVQAEMAMRQQTMQFEQSLKTSQQQFEQALAEQRAMFEANLALGKAEAEAALAQWKAQQEASRKVDMPDNRPGGDLSK